MTREEQIKKAAVSFCRVEEAPDGFAFIPQSSFVTGALWADAHPNWEAIVKRLQEEITNDLRKDRWISVEDELPKDGQYTATINKAGVQDVRHYSHGKWYSNFGNEYNDVTHWMPLPDEPTSKKAQFCPGCVMAKYPPCSLHIPCCKCDDECNSRQPCLKKGGEQ